MAKLNFGNMPPRANMNVRGVIAIAPHPQGWIARAWPRKRTKAENTTPPRLYQFAEFAVLAQQAGQIDGIAQQTATNIVKGSDYIWRDVAMKAMLGTLYEIKVRGVGIMPAARDMTANVQYVLEQLGSINGSMIFRAADGWYALLPETNGKVLTLENGEPSWQPNQAPAQAGSIVADYRSGKWYTPFPLVPGGTNAIGATILGMSFGVITEQINVATLACRASGSATSLAIGVYEVINGVATLIANTAALGPTAAAFATFQSAPATGNLILNAGQLYGFATIASGPTSFVCGATALAAAIIGTNTVADALTSSATFGGKSATNTYSAGFPATINISSMSDIAATISTGGAPIIALQLV